jgi:membrane-bound serine protease (ClpP class)
MVATAPQRAPGPPGGLARALARLLLLVCLGLAAGAAAATAPRVLVLEVDGVIGPAQSDYLTRAIDGAAAREVDLVLIRLDTPGGLDSSMRTIVKSILAARRPVACHVAPEGARAASAGTFILYACHVAAMAPATNLGAATPVAIGMPGGSGAPPPKPRDDKASEPAPLADAMTAKQVNDAAAYIRSLAQLRGRNAEFAERAVREARSLSAEDALAAGVVDLIAQDTPALLARLHGREVKLERGSHTIRTEGASVVVQAPDWRTRVLGVIATPTVALVLMMIGVYGLFIEFTSPGFGVPGVAGAIALLIGLYALQLLPVNWAGVALLVLGVLLMVAELLMPSFGVLGIGGVIALVVGGLMLIDTDVPGFGVPWWFVAALAATSALVVFAVGGMALRARQRPVVAGQHELIGCTGRVIEADGNAGWAELRGERWRVRSAQPLHVGDTVRVQALEGLTLVVTAA